MFRLSGKCVNLVNNVVKKNPKICMDKKTYKTLVKIPKSVINAAFYCKDVKTINEPKSPLANIFAKEAQKENEQEPADKEDSKQQREKSWQRMKYSLMFLGFSFTCGGTYLILELGKPRISETGIEIKDRFSDMPTINQYIMRTLNELNYYKQLIREPSREKLLPDMVKLPYYAPKYTLVLEFTDVLVHPEWTYNTGWRFKKRPGIDLFLESLSGIYEIVIYTAEQGMTVFPIVEALDPKNHIHYKLVRDATLFEDGVHIKDLSKLNRDLEKTIVIDWDPKSTKYHPDNVFHIPRWNGNDDDATLLNLTAFLLAISQNQIEDIRQVVQFYNQFPDPLQAFRERQKQLLESVEQSSQQPPPQSPIKKWSPSFLKTNH